MSALWYSSVFPQNFIIIKIKFADMTKIRANSICGIEQCGAGTGHGRGMFPQSQCRL